MGFLIKGYNCDAEQEVLDKQQSDNLKSLDIFGSNSSVGTHNDNTDTSNVIESGAVDALEQEPSESTIEEDLYIERVNASNSADNNKDCVNVNKNNTRTCNKEMQDSEVKGIPSLFDYICKKADDVDMKEIGRNAQDIYNKGKSFGSKITEYTRPLLRKVNNFLKNKAQQRISAIQDFNIRNKFRSGTIIKGKDFTFVLNDNNELMLKAYTGVSTEVNIPDSVKGFRVCYINPSFLSGRKLISTINSVSSDNMDSCDVDSIINNSRGVTSMRLPLYLKKIPKKCFIGCSEIDKLFIPPNVLAIDPKAFSKASIKKIVFEGPCPKGLKYAIISEDTNVFCNRKHSNTFSDINHFKLNVM